MTDTRDPFSPSTIPKNPPGNVSDLHRRIDKYAREHVMAADRIAQRVATEVFLGLLEAAKAREVIQTYLVKGGMAIEIRFGILARASKDVDIGIVAPIDDLVNVFNRVLEVGFGDFTFSQKSLQKLDNVRTLRIAVQISYRGKIFRTLDVDLNEANHESASEIVTTSLLTAIGLPGPLSITVLNSHTQIAHKLHGATEPSRDDYQNLRYRDLLDVLIFADNEPAIDFSKLRVIASDEFARRPYNRAWPPTFTLPQSWHEPLRNEAVRIGIIDSNPEAFVRQFIAFIARIEGIDVRPTYEYDIIRLQRNIADSGPALTDEAQSLLDSRMRDNWRAISFNPDQHFIDQFLIILERALDDTDARA